MSEQDDIVVLKNFWSTGIANCALGVLVAVIYFQWPKYGYFVFATYYALMTYEFYGFIKSNWDIIKSQFSTETTDARTKKKCRKRGKSNRNATSAVKTEFPPPIDTDDENPYENNDIVTVDLPESWDPSDGSDEDEGYYDATGLIF